MPTLEKLDIPLNCQNNPISNNEYKKMAENVNISDLVEEFIQIRDNISLLKERLRFVK